MNITRLSLVFGTLVVSNVLLFVVYTIVQNQFFSIQFTTTEKNTDKLDHLFSINTAGCKIPYMHAIDEHIIQYINNEEMPVCNEGKPSLFASNLTSIYLLKSSLPFYQVNDSTELNCCFAPFFRQEPKEDESDNKINITDCQYFNEIIDIEEEFIQVTCEHDNTTIYTDTFAFVPIKNRKKVNTKGMNVLVVGLDAVSRLNLHRQMPKTVKYLKEIQAVELLGYNKVGDNTFPNLIPVLTGFSEEELVNVCWPNKNDHFDKCTFIWDLYKKDGYLTAYGEDSSWMGLFNYERTGFITQATDYAYNYFNRYSEEAIGNSESMNVLDCVSGRLVFRELLGYINNFVKTMTLNNLPYFGFFWGASLSHDILNKPKLGDEDYYNFFKELLENGYLNNTALFFISDHGIRWGSFRETFQGLMEERLPFVFAILPRVFQEKYPTLYENLKINTKRLTTPFDLHETLLHLQTLSNIEQNELSQTSRGISLFKKISLQRTCEEAGIASHWCTCQQSVKIDTNDSLVQNASNAVLDHLNNLLIGYAQCAELTLNEVVNARVMKHSSEIKGSNMITDYILTIKALPSEAVFEATVRYKEGTNFEIIGSVSRLNLYGKQSSCITDFHLKLYCYCKNILY